MGAFGFSDIVLLCLGVATYFVYRSRRSTPLPYPPGLPQWPLIGNALSIPTKYRHRAYKELGRKLGSKIMHLKAFGQSIIIINDAEITRDLLEKRSASYSSRPRVVMVFDVMKMDYIFTLMPYNDGWRHHRRLFQQYFSPKAIARDQEIILDFVRKGLLPNLYQFPGDVHGHVRSLTGGISISMVYGLPVQRNNDPTMYLAEQAFTAATSACVPGKYLVEVIPLLKHVPEWMPGAGFKRIAREAKALVDQVTEEPYQAALMMIENGTARASFVSEGLEQYKDATDFEFQALNIKQAAVANYGAASETSTAAAMTFILAMLKYPDIQRKAQEEIDSIVGTERLPDFSDQSNLPYVSAVLREVLRWNPPLSLGVPHLTTSEDSYNGYYIPNESVVIANAYAMLHDEEIFQDPSEFKPERFLKNGKISDDLPNPETYATFGFGRRICPGAHVGLSILYLAAVSVLAVFDITPVLDANGNPVDMDPGFVADSLVSEPLPFRCNITPRKGKNVENLLREYLDVTVI